MDLLTPFAQFLTKVVLPQNPGYLSWINRGNVEGRLHAIRTEYKTSFGSEPFDVDLDHRSEFTDQLASSLKRRTDTPFETFNAASGNGIPHAILNTHFVRFLKYYNQVLRFDNMQSYVDAVHEELGQTFCNKFQRTRIEYNGKSRVGSSSLLFGLVREDGWTINKGSEREIQYHIYFRDTEIGYGLAFNAQRTQNNLTPIANVKPFVNSFFSKYEKVTALLPDYNYIINDEKMLANMQEGQFVCFGKNIPISRDEATSENLSVNGLDFLEMIYDLSGKQFEAYKMIFQNSKTAPTMDLANFELINLLKFKKQIILQGPPGTGKTKKAKQLAGALIGISIADDPKISDQAIIEALAGVAQLSTVAGRADYEIVKVDPQARQVILKKSTEKPAITSFDKIKEFYEDDIWRKSTSSNDDRRAAAIAGYIAENKPKLRSSDQFKLVQFHPSYSYEDFVRGIIAKPNDDGEGMLYEAENKILAEFARKAHENYLGSRNPNATSTKADLAAFISHIIADLDENEQFDLTDNVYIFFVDDKRFKYKGDNWKRHSKGLSMKFSELEKINASGRWSRAEIVENPDLKALTRSHATYYAKFFEEFHKFVSRSPKTNGASQHEKNYVLIIDEINRANLSSVLGELIYALEYRGETVESMYAVDGSNGLVLPPNLYIIGTMNTADRSVGHIDYAIRRRFAFVDVQPKDLTTELSDKFHKGLFDKVAALFNHDANLSTEFEAKDVQLGHSYFIDKSEEGGNIDIRLKYEIKPILKEYIKDGILIGEREGKSIEKYIEELQ